MSSLQNRNESLVDISKMVIDGNIVHKLDNIAIIFINNKFYFNVFRRYNSPYNIVIEDYNSDIYLHQDYTVRTSLKNILCLTEYDASNIYTWTATSYKHNGPISITNKDIVDMRWSDIHRHYQAINVNFGGIFNNNSVQDQIPSTPCDQMIPELTTPPSINEKAVLSTITNEDREVANTLLSLKIPIFNNEFKMSESDDSILSMCFADIIKNNTHNMECYSNICEMNESEIPVCHSNMVDDEDDDEDYNTSEDASEDTSEDTSEDYDTKDVIDNYTVLRSGSMIPKNIIDKDDSNVEEDYILEPCKFRASLPKVWQGTHLSH
jgi:hypothetical protein